MPARKAADRYREMTADQLRDEAKRAGVSGVSRMRKQDLVEALQSGPRRSGGSGGRPSGSKTTGDGAGRSRASAGKQSSKSLKYSQEIRSTDEREERPGRSLHTRDHEVIKQWAKARKATPATVPGTEHGDRIGVLRFDFPGYGGGDLKHVSWKEWFRTFDERNLNFIYQEHKSDGSQSNFFRLENPEREDA